MAARKKGAIRVLRVKKGETNKSLYARLRKAFTAADLQKYTEIEEGIPAQQLLAELETIDREERQKRKKRRRMAGPGNGVGRFAIHCSGAIAAAIRRVHRQAREEGSLRRFDTIRM
jgi:hypothetical protein